MCAKSDEGTDQVMLTLITTGMFAVIGANSIILAWMSNEMGMDAGTRNLAAIALVVGVVTLIVGVNYPALESHVRKILKSRGESA